MKPVGAAPGTAVPAVVVGGYLGAGKTTLVNHLLRHAGGRRIAVLVNDFGEVSIDADLIVGAAGEVLALAGGCVCCSFGADLVGTLQKVVRRDPLPDVVLIECSGVGLPAAVARSAALVPGIRVEGIAVVVDAADLMRLARDAYVGDTVRQQLSQADLLLVNQADRAGLDAMAQLAQWLADAAPGVPQVTCTRAQVPADLVLGLSSREEGVVAARLDEDAIERFGAPHYANHGGRSADRFRYFSRRVDGPVDVWALAAELASADADLLRAKGVVRGLDGQSWLVQVMGRRSSIERAPPDAAAGTLACIALSAASTGS